MKEHVYDDVNYCLRQIKVAATKLISYLRCNKVIRLTAYKNGPSFMLVYEAWQIVYNCIIFYLLSTIWRYLLRPGFCILHGKLYKTVIFTY